MPRPLLEVADIFHHHGAAYLRDHGTRVNRDQRRVIGAIEACRTAALGGHVDECGDCGHARIAYNSCRNRHCPKCQGSAARRWLEARCAELLPVAYFHVVFTLPAPIAEIAFYNKAIVYGLLMQTAAETLKIIAADTRHLGAQIGGIAVLHTWGQTLTHHPHVHCIVPGGGLTTDTDGERWISCRPGFFLPVRVLARLFRRLFLERLVRAHRNATLAFPDTLQALRSESVFKTHLAPLARTDWVVYAKPPFGGPDQVLAYLSRYTHRVAISNSRLVACDGESIRFRYKDYRQSGHERFKTMALEPAEFIRRFLQHVLPRGFHRIGHFGFFANGHRTDKIARIRCLLESIDSREPEPDEESREEPGHNRSDKSIVTACPCCGGIMRRVFEWNTVPPRARWPDTS
ncbi:MAG: IS91 family transposase [Alphaproteobacteria bacterium]